MHFRPKANAFGGRRPVGVQPFRSYFALLRTTTRDKVALLVHKQTCDDCPEHQANDYFKASVTL